MFFNEFGELLKPWSSSKLKTIKNCGAKFWMDYVYKHYTGKKHPCESISSPALELGTKIHKTMEDAFTFRNKGIIDASIERDKTKFPGLEEYKFGMNNVYERIASFLALSAGSKLQVEKGFGIDLDGKIYTFFDNNSIMRIKMDIFLEYMSPKESKPCASIIDIKSGKYYIEETTEQLEIYAAALRLAYPHLERISFQAALVNQPMADMIMTPKLFWDFEKDPKKLITEKINDYIKFLPKDLNKLVRDKKYLSTKDYMCNGCPYKKWCPKFDGKPEDI